MRKLTFCDLCVAFFSFQTLKMQFSAKRQQFVTDVWPAKYLNEYTVFTLLNQNYSQWTTINDVISKKLFTAKEFVEASPNFAFVLKRLTRGEGGNNYHFKNPKFLQEDR
jgi:hypothetical protein